MKKTLALFLIFVTAGMLFFLKDYYRQKNSALSSSLSLKWSMAPGQIKDLSVPVLFKFHLTDSQQNKISDARINVVANMSHPGMVPVEGIVQNLGHGDYKTRVVLTMPGDWILFLTITLKNGTVEKKEVLFKTVQ